MTTQQVFIDHWTAITDRVCRETPSVARQDGFRIAVYRKHEADPFDKGEYVGFVGIAQGDFELMPRQFAAIQQDENRRILAQVRQIVAEETGEIR